MPQTTSRPPGPGVLDRFLAVVAEDLEPAQQQRLRALSVAPGDAVEERRRACELLTRVRDWTATALGKAGASVPMLPPGAVRTGDDAFRLLRALEPVADELDALAAGPPLRQLVNAATAAARSGTELAVPADDDVLDVGRRAGQVLDGWAAAGLGDPVEAAEETIRAAAGPPP